MRPLDPLASVSPIGQLLRQAPSHDVRAELSRLERDLPRSPPAGSSEALMAAAFLYGCGARRLRDGDLDVARTELDASADAFLDEGEVEAGLLARCEALLAALRKGPRFAYAPAIAKLDALVARAIGESLPRVVVVALHYRGTAERLSGDALATQSTLLDALARSGPYVEERAQLLNSLGTLYVVLGAYGAAKSLLEHAAEVHQQGGDVIGEAIAHGQLGAAALALRDLEGARRHLQRQEWLASRVGDAFGQSRACNFLAELALEVGHPDDAADLARRAIGIAERVTPPLSLWIAYATRILGRATLDLGLPEARRHLEAAHAQFVRFGNPLGQALSGWDLARCAALEGKTGDWFTPAWALGSLGLGGRVAKLLADLGASGANGAPSALALAATAQAAPELAVTHEIELLHRAPAVLTAVAGRRVAAQRNLGRLGALAIAPPGLVVAAIVSPAIGVVSAGLPPDRASAAALATLPGAVVWGWPASTPVVEMARDLAALCMALGPDTRARVVLAPLGRALAPPFLGEVGVVLEGVDTVALLGEAAALGLNRFSVAADVGWSPEAHTIVATAGLARETDGSPIPVAPY